MTTQAITYTVPSPAWTGSVDVTLANLLADVTIKDFILLYNNIEQGTTEKAFWAKTSYTQLTYSGSSLTTNDVVTIKRKTPNTVVQTVTPQSIILSSLWNAEFDRVTRRADEYDAFFNIGTPVTGNIVDTSYSAAWDGVTGDSPSKNTIYDLFNTDTVSVRPNWTITTGGSLTAATGSTVTLNSGSTLVNNATTTLNLGATSVLNANSGSTVTFGSGSSIVFNASAPVTGTVDMDAATSVLVPTSSITNVGGQVTTNAASQAWVYSNLPHVFEARLSVHASDPLGRGSSTTIYLHPYKGNAVTLYNNSRWELSFLSGTVSLAVGTMTDNLPYDIFLFNNSGTLTLEKLAWASATTRDTALTTQNGVYVKTGATDRRYVGTMFSPTSSTVVMSPTTINMKYNAGYVTTIGYLGLANYYNQESIRILKYDQDSGVLQNSSYCFNSSVWSSATQLLTVNNPNYSKFVVASTGINTEVRVNFNGAFYRSGVTTYGILHYVSTISDAGSQTASFIGGSGYVTTYTGDPNPVSLSFTGNPSQGYFPCMLQGIYITNSPQLYYECSQELVAKV